MPSRCFVAVPLGEGSRMLVADARAAFLVAAPSWSREKWVRPDLVHLTLTFVGPLPDSALDDVLAAITAECSVHEPFELTASGCRAVPTDEWARMLWATLGGGTDACTRLARGISEVLAERFSVPRDTRPFAPASRDPRRLQHSAPRARPSCPVRKRTGPCQSRMSRSTRARWGRAVRPTRSSAWRASGDDQGTARAD
jgi:2'-5' RNA ligase